LQGYGYGRQRKMIVEFYSIVGMSRPAITSETHLLSDRRDSG